MVLQQLSCLRARFRHGDQQVLRADEFVGQTLCFREGLLEDPLHIIRQMRSRKPRNLRHGCKLLLCLAPNVIEVCADLVEDGGDDTLGVVDHGRQQVQRLNGRMLHRGRRLLRRLYDFLRLEGEFVEVHDVCPSVMTGTVTICPP